MADTTSRAGQQDGDTQDPTTEGATASSWRPSRRALLLGAAGVVVAAGAGTALAVLDLPGDGGPVRPAPTPTTPLPPAPEAAKAGVFRGTDAAAVRAFEAWAGHPVDYVIDYSSRATWEEIVDPQYLLQEWHDTPYRLVLAVAMLPDDEEGSMEAGAGGEYDGYFAELASTLVAAGRQDSVLRLGWEFNLAESRYNTEDPEVFIGYWRRIVETMRAVPGQEFEFDWNPNNSDNPFDASNYYPGDDVVDYVGVDAYDASWINDTYPYPGGCDPACHTKRQDRAWNEDIYGGERGLLFWVQFAAEHDKPLSLPEWGLWARPDGHGGGENPRFIERMHQFIATNNVAYHAYFEYAADDGTHLLTQDFPQSGQVYRSLFGAERSAVAASPSASPPA